MTTTAAPSAAPERGSATGPSATRRAPGLPCRLAILLLVLGAIGLSWTWATASPAGSSPDEPAHITYAWGTATGQTLPWRVQTNWDTSSKRTMVVVNMPDSLNPTVPVECYVGRAMDADCQLFTSHGTNHLYGTYMDRYPLVYYTYVGFILRFAIHFGASGATALVLARFGSALLSCAVLGAAGWVLGRRFGIPTTVIVLTLPMTPVAWFLSGSVNPNGLEWTLAMLLGALVVAACADASRTGRVSRGLAWALPVASLALAWTRPVSIVWTVALLLVLVLRVPGHGPRPIALLPRLHRLLLLIAVVLGGVWFFYQASGSSEDTSTAFDGGDWDALPVLLRLWMIVARFGFLLQSGFGYLGWQDTQLPMIVLLTWLLVGGGVLTFLIARRRRLAVISSRAILMVVGLGVLAVIVESYSAGFGWQGRYWYPSIVGAIVLLVGRVADSAAHDSTRTSRSAATGVVVLAAVTMVISIVYNNLRYVYGYHDAYQRFDPVTYAWRSSVWSPYDGDTTFWVVSTVTIIITTVALLALVLARPRVSTTSDESGSPVSEQPEAGEPGAGASVHEGSSTALPTAEGGDRA